MSKTLQSITSIKRISDCVWEIPVDLRSDMLVPARVYATENMLTDALQDSALEQLINTATLPGAVKYVIAMPDVHQGYGMPVGGVMATALPDGIISPGAVGYDINCGVRLLASNLSHKDIAAYCSDLATSLYRNCPSGVGSEGSIDLSYQDLDDVLVHGSLWALRKGFAFKLDLQRTEENGCLKHADASFVSDKAKHRGKDQLGTLGAGNHFIEIDRVTEIYDDTIALRLGLFLNQITVQIHCGSRGLGHQVCTDYVHSFQKVAQKYKISLPDRELVCAPFSSDEGQSYFKAMACAANFAFANRQVLAYHIRRSFEETLAKKHLNSQLYQVYDIAHNMAKVEEHIIDNRQLKVCVHRKGATRAFGPGFKELPEDLRDIGQPILIPGSMGTASFVLIGTNDSMDQTFGSCCHGAGRVMSRSRAKKEVRGEHLRNELAEKGIDIRAGSLSGLAEEAPLAYKDVTHVVDVVHNAGIGMKVAKLEPIAVIKG